MGKSEIIYGQHNGLGYRDITDRENPKTLIHRDPRLTVKVYDEEARRMGEGVVLGIQLPYEPDDERFDGDDPYDPDSGAFMTLDRDGINRLIRALRRFRDQVFEPDA